MFFLLSAALGLAATVAAGTNYDINVGKGAVLKFDPETLSNVAAGDTLTYHFFAKNHSVTQSSFADPCHPLANGFFSGFTPSASNDTAGPTTFTVTVNDTKPIWVYCGQTKGDHCQGGMVHSINAPASGNTFDAYKAKAAVASTSTSPPGGLPVGGLRKLHVDVAPGATLTFSPSNITELVGTVVEFSFNPANHSVVQSSFADPCHPLAAGGFSSGFIPTTASPSGVLFDITINDTKPIWFYCAQTKKTHCQAGMVGSINAPTTGNTLEAFIAKAKTASDSTIPPNAPIGGLITANGTAIPSFGGAVFSNAGGLNNGAISTIPPPGQAIPPAMAGDAGGNPPKSYGWAPTISLNATNGLQLLQFLDNLLIDILVNSHNRLTTGDWSSQYPASITNMMGSMTAQAVVHRSTSTDCLTNYQKKIIAPCKYNYPNSSPADFTTTALTVLALEIGLIIDLAATQAGADPWLVAPLASTLGAKSRMAALLNMMQNHLPAAAVREVALPPDLVYSYAMTHYVVAGSCPDALAWTPANVTPEMKVSDKMMTGTRLTSMTVGYDNSKASGDLWMAWIGPWGDMEYSQVKKGSAGSGSVDVPTDLYGHVWGVLTTDKNAQVQDLGKSAVAGPEMIWVTQATN